MLTRRRYRGKHRGTYRPSWHWPHLACYPWGCHIATETAELHIYYDASGPARGGECEVLPHQTIGFAVAE